MKAFVLVVSIWGNNGTDWVYTGNQYIMQDLLTQEECSNIADTSNWNKLRNNPYYDIQFDCFNKEEYNG